MVKIGMFPEEGYGKITYLGRAKDIEAGMGKMVYSDVKLFSQFFSVQSP